MSNDHKTLYRRLTASVPLLVTVIIHVVLFVIAGYFVVSKTILTPKRTFEGTAESTNVAEKQIEHRLQVARKGGGGSTNSPVSMNRIFSTSSNAIQVAMPELPSNSTAQAGFGSFGQGAGVGNGTSGFGTGLGNASSGGRGFMSLNFLGITSAKAQKVVFVVDISSNLLDIKKGGFRAFTIIREQMSNLVGKLSPATEFGIVLVDYTGWDVGGRHYLFNPKLLPATIENKQLFFDWLKPINTDLNVLGGKSIRAPLLWKRTSPEGSGLDSDYFPTAWINGFQAAIEMKPDTVFVITATTSNGEIKMTDQQKEERRIKVREQYEAYKKKGIDLVAMSKLRRAAYAKARAELDAANKQLVAKGKDPLIITDPRRFFDADFKSAMAKAGVNIKLDTAGWTDKDGKPILVDDSVFDEEKENTVPMITVTKSHLSKMQAYFSPKNKVVLNLFLFVGPDDQAKGKVADLSAFASANNGRFELLTTKKLEQLAGDSK
jgi:hypothetical protein